MDVRVIIVSHPDATYQVCVLAPEQLPVRSWMRMYDSKLLCMTELRSIDLLTPIEADDALATDFEGRDAVLVARTHTDPDTLSAAGFIEREKDFIN